MIYLDKNSLWSVLFFLLLSLSCTWLVPQIIFLIFKIQKSPLMSLDYKWQNFGTKRAFRNHLLPSVLVGSEVMVICSHNFSLFLLSLSLFFFFLVSPSFLWQGGELNWLTAFCMLGTVLGAFCAWPHLSPTWLRKDSITSKYRGEEAPVWEKWFISSNTAG